MLYTKAEAAKELRRSTRTIQRYIKDGLLEATKAPGRAGHIRISAEAIAAFLERQKVNPAESETAAR